MVTSLAINPITTEHRNEAGGVLGSHGNQQLSNTVETENKKKNHTTIKTVYTKVCTSIETNMYKMSLKSGVALQQTLVFARRHMGTKLQ